MSMFDLTGHVAIVTGGNGGLGLAFARGLVKSGASVAIWGRDGDKNAAAIEELRAMDGDVEAFGCDVTDEKEVATAFAQALERFGHIDSCFANAGGGGFRGMSHQTDRKAWLDTIDLNLMSVVQTWAPVTEHMLARGQGGRLIVTSSIASLMGSGGAAGYSTTKAAVRGLVQALALELGQAGIRVNAILPGFIETEMTDKLDEKTVQSWRDAIPLKRGGQPEDVADCALFLASDLSTYITGQVLQVDGGMLT